MKTIYVSEVLSDSQTHALLGKVITTDFVHTIITEPTIVRLATTGDILAVFITDAIPAEVADAAEPIFLKAARSSVIGGFRGTAAGTGTTPATKKDGTPSKMRRVPRVERLAGAKDGVLGYLDASNFHPCRLTAMTAQYFETFTTDAVPYVTEVGSVFREHLPQRWGAQALAASATPGYCIPATVFSTVTCNLNFSTAGHYDKGDYAEGFGVISVFPRGVYSGGLTVFPKYGVAFDVRERSVLLADVHQLHANTPLVGEGGFQRLACVFYYRDGLKSCNQ